MGQVGGLGRGGPEGQGGRLVAEFWLGLGLGL